MNVPFLLLLLEKELQFITSTFQENLQTTNMCQWFTTFLLQLQVVRENLTMLNSRRRSLHPFHLQLVPMYLNRWLLRYPRRRLEEDRRRYRENTWSSRATFEKCKLCCQTRWYANQTGRTQTSRYKEGQLEAQNVQASERPHQKNLVGHSRATI